MKKLATATASLTTTTGGAANNPYPRIQNLDGLRKDRIDCSSNKLYIGINTYMEGEGNIHGEDLLCVKWGCAVGNIQRMWRGWYVCKLIKSKS